MKTKSKFLSDSKGIMSIEFAIIIPILFALFLVMVEFSRYIYHKQKIAKVSGNYADMISLFQPIDTTKTTAEIEAELGATCNGLPLMITENRLEAMLDPEIVEALLTPIPANSGAVIISLVNKEAGIDPVISWQYEYNPGFGFYSDLGNQGNNANMPSINGTPGGMLDNENMIVVEAALEYRSIISGALNNIAPGIASGLITETTYYPVRNYKRDVNLLPEFGLNYTWPDDLPPSMAPTTNPNNC